MADVRIASADNLDDNTPQTPGIHRLVAFDSRTPEASALCAFLADIAPGAVTGAHHHGEQDTVLYVISGRARYRWGDQLDHVAEAGPGDFVLIPAHTIHQEINASDREPTVWAVVRSGTDPIVVNLPELDAIAEQPAVQYD